MRNILATCSIVLSLAALPAAAGAQQAAPAADASVTTPPPAPPWEAARTPDSGIPRGPVLPSQVRPAAERALADEAPAPAPPDNVVIPITTLTIVLAVILLIVLID